MADLDATADPAPGSAQTRDTGRMVDDTARDRAIYHALKAADEAAAPETPIPWWDGRPRGSGSRHDDQQAAENLNSII
jgi:hypothetical protein